MERDSKPTWGTSFGRERVQWTAKAHLSLNSLRFAHPVAKLDPPCSLASDVDRQLGLLAPAFQGIEPPGRGLAGPQAPGLNDLALFVVHLDGD